MQSIGEKWLNHFEQFFGAYDQVKRYRYLNANLQILAFPKVVSECVVFASLGFSHFQKDTEIYAITDTAFETISDLMGDLLNHWMFEMRHQLVAGFCLDVSEILPTGFIETTGKDSVYFTQSSIFPPQFLTENFQPLQMLLVSKGERGFIRQFGSDAFEEALEANQVDVFNIRRNSLFDHL